MTREDAVRELAQLAMVAGLADPQRRLLLLFGLPRAVVARLCYQPRPLDQLFADLTAIYSNADWMHHWFENALLLAAGQHECGRIVDLRSLWLDA